MGIVYEYGAISDAGQNGSKLHLLCNERGELVNFVLTRVNVDDRNESVIDTLTDKVFGKLYADKGYISQSLFGHLWDDGIHIVTGLRSNMRQQLMPIYDKIILRKRSIIESVNDMLKNVPQLVHLRHRSEHNFLILARSKHTLMMARNKWNDIQRHRANILFWHYPILKKAYELAMELRSIFNRKTKRTTAMKLMNRWYEKVSALGNPNFRSVIKTFKNHALTIINYFLRRATNASAEAFNSKVKIFRSQMRGVRDRDFFIFRLVKLFA